MQWLPSAVSVFLHHGERKRQEGGIDAHTGSTAETRDPASKIVGRIYSKIVVLCTRASKAKKKKQKQKPHQHMFIRRTEENTGPSPQCTSTQGFHGMDRREFA